MVDRNAEAIAGSIGAVTPRRNALAHLAAGLGLLGPGVASEAVAGRRGGKHDVSAAGGKKRKKGKPGPAGPAGLAGPSGPTGPPGVMATEVVEGNSASLDMAAGSEAFSIAQCPAGAVLVGGGHNITLGSTTGLFHGASLPNSASGTFQVTFIRIAAAGGTTSFRAYAICAS